MNISLVVRRNHALFFVILFHLRITWKSNRYLNFLSSTVQIQPARVELPVFLFRCRLIAEFQPVVGMSEQLSKIREGTKA